MKYTIIVKFLSKQEVTIERMLVTGDMHAEINAILETEYPDWRV